jgi:uncharacterized membrane protein
MAALAYVLLPLSGLVAYALGTSPRMRLHGLQAIALGAAWPAALFVASWISQWVTRVVFAVGALTWIALIVLTAAGRDPGLPGLKGLLQRAAALPPGGTGPMRGDARR